MTDDEFLSRFESGTLERFQWTHEAHIRMAWLYLSRFPFSVALQRVRNGIWRLNSVFNQMKPPEPRRSWLPCLTRSKPKSGYHETVTVAYVRLIASRRLEEEDFPAFRERNPDLFDSKNPVLHRMYSRERLESQEARRAFVEPDLQRLV
jgi:hypothetical protein